MADGEDSGRPGGGIEPTGAGAFVADQEKVGTKGDYHLWDWRDIMARIMGASAVSEDSGITSAQMARIVSPQSLIRASANFQMATELLGLLGQRLTQYLDVLVGEDGPWQGEAARTFDNSVRPMAKALLNHAEQLGGGPMGSKPVHPSLWSSGQYLDWAQQTIRDIQAFYVAESRRLGDLQGVDVELDDGRVYISWNKKLDQAMSNSMRQVLIALATHYENNQNFVMEPRQVDPPRNEPPGGGGFDTPEIPDPEDFEFEPPPPPEPSEFNPEEFSPEQPNPEQFNPGEFNPEQFSPEQPNLEQPNPEQFNPGSFDPAQLNAEQPNPEQFNPGQFNPEQFNPEQPNPEQFNPGQFNPEQFNPDQPNPEQFNPGQFNPGQFNPEGFGGGSSPGSEVPPFAPVPPGGGLGGLPGGNRPGGGVGSPNLNDPPGSGLGNPDLTDPPESGLGNPNLEQLEDPAAPLGGSGLGRDAPMMPPMMPPMSPGAGGAGQGGGAEQPDASGLLGGIDKPWETETPVVGDPPAAELPSASPQDWATGEAAQTSPTEQTAPTSPMMPPMMPPMSPGAGGGGQGGGAEQPDASGLLGGVEEPWQTDAPQEEPSAAELPAAQEDWAVAAAGVAGPEADLTGSDMPELAVAGPEASEAVAATAGSEGNDAEATGGHEGDLEATAAPMTPMTTVPPMVPIPPTTTPMPPPGAGDRRDAASRPDAAELLAGVDEPWRTRAPSGESAGTPEEQPARMPAVPEEGDGPLDPGQFSHSPAAPDPATFEEVPFEDVPFALDEPLGQEAPDEEPLEPLHDEALDELDALDGEDDEDDELGEDVVPVVRVDDEPDTAAWDAGQGLGFAWAGGQGVRGRDDGADEDRREGHSGFVLGDSTPWGHASASASISASASAAAGNPRLREGGIDAVRNSLLSIEDYLPVRDVLGGQQAGGTGAEPPARSGEHEQADPPARDDDEPEEEPEEEPDRSASDLLRRHDDGWSADDRRPPPGVIE